MIRVYLSIAFVIMTFTMYMLLMCVFERLGCQNGILFAVAYASNIGGTGSIFGTGPNLIMKEKAFS